ncbi:MAG: hypothetical protein LC632_04505 [Xanthomonadaceae bacterium]|nr:hypothetical protein [Xanthomonadaceae bacterium]
MFKALFIVISALLLAACASQPVAQPVITLPMAAPAMPAAGGSKDEPLRIGTSVAVPQNASMVELDALAWSDAGVARFTIAWPPVRSFRMQLRAEGKWNPATRVRVLSPAGEPLHVDYWHPADQPRWWSAVGDGPHMLVEIVGRPGPDAVLRVISADALGRAE